MTTLTPQETRVMDSLVTGQTTKEMAQEMGISTRTVEVHRRSCVAKLGARNFVHAAVLWDRERIRRELDKANSTIIDLQMQARKARG